MKKDYEVIQEDMLGRIRFLEDELYKRAYPEIEQLEAEIEKLKKKCLKLMFENADYVWDEMMRAEQVMRANRRKWKAK